MFAFTVGNFGCEETHSIRLEQRELENILNSQLSNDDNIKVHLSTAIDPTDAQATDVQYHNNCWNKYVCNVLRKPNAKGPSKSDFDTEISSEIKLLSIILRLLDGLLADGNKLAQISKAQVDCSIDVMQKTFMFVLS